jgi:hypothetical protein
MGVDIGHGLRRFRGDRREKVSVTQRNYNGGGRHPFMIKLILKSNMIPLGLVIEIVIHQLIICVPGPIGDAPTTIGAINVSANQEFRAIGVA